MKVGRAKTRGSFSKSMGGREEGAPPQQERAWTRRSSFRVQAHAGWKNHGSCDGHKLIFQSHYAALMAIRLKKWGFN